MKTMQKPNQEFAIRGQKKPKCITDLIPLYVSKLSCQEEKCRYLGTHGYYLGGGGEYLVYSPKKSFKETKLRRFFFLKSTKLQNHRQILSTP